MRTVEPVPFFRKKTLFSYPYAFYLGLSLWPLSAYAATESLYDGFMYSPSFTEPAVAKPAVNEPEKTPAQTTEPAKAQLKAINLEGGALDLPKQEPKESEAVKVLETSEVFAIVVKPPKSEAEASSEVSAVATEVIKTSNEIGSPSKAGLKPIFATKPILPRSLLGTMPEANVAHAGKVDLRDAMEIVMDWHPSIKRSMSMINQNEENINVARSGYFPSLQASVRSGFDDQGNYDRKRTVNSDLVVSASQMLYDFGQTASQVKFAEAALQKEKYSLDRTVNQLLYSVSNAYIEVVRYSRLVTVAKNQVAGFTEINKIAEQRAVLGASAYSDYSQAKVRLAIAESLLYDYQAQLFKWSAVLDNYANQKISARLLFDFPVLLESACTRLDLDSLQAPGVTVAEAEADMAKSQLSAAKAAAFPKLSIAPTYEYRLNNDETAYSRRTRGNFGVFLNVSIPLMEGGAITARRNEARQALLAAQSNVDTERTDALQRILDAVSQVESTRHSLSAKLQRESGAVQTRDLYRLQYIELGNRPFSDLLNAEGEIYQTHMDIVNGTYTIQKLSIECLYQSGQLLNNLMSLPKQS